MTYIIHRKTSRFARGELRDAIIFMQEHRDIHYPTEDAAFQRVCEEVAMLAAKYRAQPQMTARRHADGSVVIPADEVGMIYVVRKAR